MGCCTVQPVSTAADGAGSQHVDRHAADRQVSSVHLHPRLHLHHHVGVRAEHDAEGGQHSLDAGVRAPGLHRRAAAPAVHAAARRGTENRRRLLAGAQRTAAVRQPVQEGKHACSETVRRRLQLRFDFDLTAIRRH